MRRIFCEYFFLNGVSELACKKMYWKITSGRRAANDKVRREGGSNTRGAKWTDREIETFDIQLHLHWQGNSKDTDWKAISQALPGSNRSKRACFARWPKHYKLKNRPIAGAPIKSSNTRAQSAPHPSSKENEKRFKARWSYREKKVLLDAVDEHGTDNNAWSLITEHLPGRSARACASLWERQSWTIAEEVNCNNEDHSRNEGNSEARSSWTREEGRTFHEAYTKYGAYFEKISDIVGRSQTTCRDYYNTTYKTR